jgi:hypothetical protein
MHKATGNDEKARKTMHLDQLVISILLSVGSASVLADVGGYGRSSREAVRAFQVQNIYLERGQQQLQMPSQSERRESRAYPGQDTSGYGGQPDNQASQTADNARRQGRMSPEERRALRRQIDEVGHDIYAPKR